MAYGISDSPKISPAAPSGAALLRQFGAIPWRRGPDGIEVLLITSRRTGRWIFPKGSHEASLSPAASAALEALEEAGVQGRLDAQPVGTYRDLKIRDDGAIPIEVELYPLETETVLDDWLEKAERRRRWAGVEEACSLVSHPDLIPMIRAVAARAGQR